MLARRACAAPGADSVSRQGNERMRAVRNALSQVFADDQLFGFEHVVPTLGPSATASAAVGPALRPSREVSRPARGRPAQTSLNALHRIKARRVGDGDVASSVGCSSTATSTVPTPAQVGFEVGTGEAAAAAGAGAGAGAGACAGAGEANAGGAQGGVPAQVAAAMSASSASASMPALHLHESPHTEARKAVAADAVVTTKDSGDAAVCNAGKSDKAAPSAGRVPPLAHLTSLGRVCMEGPVICVIPVETAGDGPRPLHSTRTVLLGSASGDWWVVQHSDDAGSGDGEHCPVSTSLGAGREQVDGVVAAGDGRLVSAHGCMLRLWDVSGSCVASEVAFVPPQATVPQNQNPPSDATASQSGSTAPAAGAAGQTQQTREGNSAVAVPRPSPPSVRLRTTLNLASTVPSIAGERTSTACMCFVSQHSCVVCCFSGGTIVTVNVSVSCRLRAPPAPPSRDRLAMSHAHHPHMFRCICAQDGALAVRHAISPPEASPGAVPAAVHACVAATNSFYAIDAAGVIRKFGVSASKAAPAKFEALGVLQAGGGDASTVKEATDCRAVLAWCGVHRVLLAATSARSVSVFDSRGKRMGSIATKGIHQPHVRAPVLFVCDTHTSIRVYRGLARVRVSPKRLLWRTDLLGGCCPSLVQICALVADSVRGDVFVGRSDGRVQVQYRLLAR